MICEKAERTDIATIDKKKYLVPSVRRTRIPHFLLDSRVAHSHRILRLGSSSTWSESVSSLLQRKPSLYLLRKYCLRQHNWWAPSMRSTSKSLSEIYTRILSLFLRDEDNFLYVSYSGENTFGREGWIELPCEPWSACFHDQPTFHLTSWLSIEGVCL